MGAESNEIAARMVIKSGLTNGCGTSYSGLLELNAKTYVHIRTRIDYITPTYFGTRVKTAYAVLDTETITDISTHLRTVFAFDKRNLYGHLQGQENIGGVGHKHTCYIQTATKENGLLADIARTD